MNYIPAGGIMETLRLQENSDPCYRPNVSCLIPSLTKPAEKTTEPKKDDRTGLILLGAIALGAFLVFAR